MIDPAILAALAEAAPKTILTVQVEAGALHRAMLERSGGPEWLSTRAASRMHGRSTGYWLARAKEWTAEDVGELHQRAYQDGPRWFLRNASCAEHLARKAAPKIGVGRRVPRGPNRRKQP